MNPISAVIFLVFLGGAGLSYAAQMPLAAPILLAVIGIFLGYSIKMAQQWERAVVLRLGKLLGVKGPGLFILVPIMVPKNLLMMSICSSALLPRFLMNWLS